MMMISPNKQEITNEFYLFFSNIGNSISGKIKYNGYSHYRHLSWYIIHEKCNIIVTQSSYLILLIYLKRNPRKNSEYSRLGILLFYGILNKKRILKHT